MERDALCTHSAAHNEGRDRTGLQMRFANAHKEAANYQIRLCARLPHTGAAVALHFSLSDLLGQS